MKSARGPAKGLGDRGDLSSLCCLPGPRDCTFRTKGGEVGVDTPAGTGSSWGVATPPVSGHAKDGVSASDLREDLGESHLGAFWAAEVPQGDVACVAQGAGCIREKSGSPGERRAEVDEMRPVSAFSSTPRTTGRASPAVVGNMGCVDRVGTQNISERLGTRVGCP